MAESIDANYSKAIAKLYGEEIEEEAEINEDDPFFKAMQRGLEKRALPDQSVEDMEK